MEPTQPRPSTRRRVLPAVLVFGLSAATLMMGLTGAIFTDSDSIGSNDFATGDVTLGTTSAELPFSVTAMAPGDTDGPHAVTVSNDGSLELRYAISSTTDEDTLAAQLDLWVWDESAEDDTGALGLGSDNAVCDASPNGTAPGSYLYTQGVLGSTGSTNLVGDPAQGSRSGDRVLAASASEVLCFFAELPLGTNDTFESLTTSATFAFESEQTANNA